MKLGTLVAGVALAATTAFGQTSTGEIAGRLSMRDERRSELPGVRVTIADGNQTQEAVTDSSGRFVFRSLSFGTYRVVAELAGFNEAVGDLAVSPSSPQVFLAWSLEIGCLAEVQRVVLASQLFMEPQEARLVPGSEYVALLGAEGHTTSDGVLPIVDGRVASPHAGELYGMRTADALRLLGSWSGKQRH